MALAHFVRRNVYHDSVTLLRLSRQLSSIPGVRRAAVMMATGPNLALLQGAGLVGDAGVEAGPADLIVAILAEDARAAETARAAADDALDERARPTSIAGVPVARTFEAALRALPDASLAVVSVPGAWAAAEAMRALRANLHVMVFSDNVTVEAEVALKREALGRGLFLMGPDCGTAILHGVPLGFANAVPRGRIGLVGASGTGLQEVACLVAAAGEGISHAIGLGGRDLTDEVGGLMLEPALDALDADPSTAVIGLIGKPPGPAVMRKLEESLGRLAKPFVAHFPGAARSVRGGYTAATLEDTAAAAVALARGAVPAPIEFTGAGGEIERTVDAAVRRAAAGQRLVRGIYAGGTLALEARALLAERLRDVAPGVTGGGGHSVVDLGDDRFTAGRPHPMIDGTLRAERLLAAGRDPASAVLLFDVVLGFGAHPDPAGDLGPALVAAKNEAAAAGRRLSLVASVCGTDADPQRRAAQIAALTALGVIVMPSNAQAARLAARIAAAIESRAETMTGGDR